MINAILDRFGSDSRGKLLDTLQDVTRSFGIDDLSTNRLSKSQMRSALRTARRGARRAASRTSAFASAHPRQVGVGIGAAAVAAIGLYAFARMHEGKDADMAEALPNTDS
ncbi:hypothetical protein [uncultured Algimonas sp.]|uniref:hypothetical protein n=1 Tax=uncultured Algimonas sp. TaxID=1547920 RepID=UPI00263542B3|nr:hypothetical protein [uncultured Algimonas sp.]